MASVGPLEVRAPVLGAASRIKRAPPPGLEPRDHTTLSSPTPTPAPRPPSPTAPSAPRTFLGTLLKTAGYTGFVMTVGASAVGGLGFLANRQALRAGSSFQIYPMQLQSAAPEHAPLLPPPPATNPAPTSVAPGGVTVYLPGGTVSQLAGQLQDNPQVKAMLQEKIERTREGVLAQLQQLKVPAGQVLVDARLPLPTSEHSFLRLGSLDLPSLGLRGLQQEAVPLALDYSTAPIRANLDVKIEPVRSDPAVQGPGIALGGVSVQILAPDGKIPVQGSLSLHLDSDGQATLPQLEQVRQQLQTSPSPALKELEGKLQARLQAGSHLRELGREQGFGDLLQDGLNQQLDFKAHIDTGKGPLAQTVYRLWLVPGGPGCQATVQVTTEAEAQAPLALSLDQLSGRATPSHGKLGEILHQEAQSHLETGLRQSLPQLTQSLQTVARQRLEQEFSQGTGQLQQLANQELERAYAQNPTISSTHLARQVQLGLNQAALDGAGDLVLQFDSAAPAPQLPSDLHLQPGELAVRLSAAEVNQQLRDVSSGGCLDWKAILGQARESAGLLDLSFGPNSLGKPDYPQLSTTPDGRMALSFDLVARMQGASPLKGATGLVKTATGGLAEGAGQVNKALKSSIGTVGDVLGQVVRAPFFLADKAVEGSKYVVDNTVGRVVDTVPELATRPTVHTRVTIPLDFKIQDGRLCVVPDGSAVKLSDPKGSLPVKVLDLLPTRLLSNLVVGLVANSQASARIGDKLQQQQLDLDLADRGLSFEQAEMVPTPNGPDLVLKLQATPQAAQVVGEKLAGL